MAQGVCKGRKEVVVGVVMVVVVGWGGHEPLESTDDSPLLSHNAGDQRNNSKARQVIY